jgi:ArsR family transcriptional regulator, arsenate/arsenite/antimonite-responsive transcriptional repressor
MDKSGALLALAALGQVTRLELFQLLVARGAEGMSAGSIAERLGVAPSSLSFHLTQLVHSGLLVQRRLGRQLIYSSETATVDELLGYLNAHCRISEASA